MIAITLTFPAYKNLIELTGIELIGDIMIEHKDYKAALIYYFQGIHFAEFSKQYARKIILYKKIGKSFKEMHDYYSAVFYYKKQLQLAWEQNDNRNELEAYDNIGLQYYYMHCIDKAIYYHNRMMNGEVEKKSAAREWDVEQLLKKRIAKVFRARSEWKTMFDLYNDAKHNDTQFIFPHENKREIAQYFLLIKQIV